MNINQLRKILKAKLRPLKRRVQVLHFWELLKMRYIKHLEVRDIENCYQIKEISGSWKVVTMERNLIREKKVFDEEKEACLYFNELMKRMYQNELSNP